MTFTGVNYLAIAIAAVAAWLASAAWYMSLSKHYVAALGKTPEQMARDRNNPGAFLPFIYAFVGNIIIAWMLAGLLAHLGAGQVTLRNGIVSAAFLWFGFILTTMIVNYSFAGRDKRLLLIDAGNWLGGRGDRRVVRERHAGPIPWGGGSAARPLSLVRSQSAVA